MHPSIAHPKSIHPFGWFLNPDRSRDSACLLACLRVQLWRYLCAAASRSANATIDF